MPTALAKMDKRLLAFTLCSLRCFLPGLKTESFNGDALTCLQDCDARYPIEKAVKDPKIRKKFLDCLTRCLAEKSPWASDEEEDPLGDCLKECFSDAFLNGGDASLEDRIVDFLICLAYCLLRRFFGRNSVQGLDEIAKIYGKCVRVCSKEFERKLAKPSVDSSTGFHFISCLLECLRDNAPKNPLIDTDSERIDLLKCLLECFKGAYYAPAAFVSTDALGGFLLQLYACLRPLLGAEVAADDAKLQGALDTLRDCVQGCLLKHAPKGTKPTLAVAIKVAACVEKCVQEKLGLTLTEEQKTKLVECVLAAFRKNFLSKPPVATTGGACSARLVLSRVDLDDPKGLLGDHTALLRVGNGRLGGTQFAEVTQSGSFERGRMVDDNGAVVSDLQIGLGTGTCGGALEISGPVRLTMVAEEEGNLFNLLFSSSKLDRTTRCRKDRVPEEFTVTLTSRTRRLTVRLTFALNTRCIG